MFETAFCEKYGINSVQVLRRFHSKKNEVILFSFLLTSNREEKWIVKKFKNPARCQKEAEILTLLYDAGLAVPKIIYAAADHLVLSYLPGITFLEWLEREEKAGCPKENYLSCLHDFARWLKAFYQITAQKLSPGLILGDVNLRNFLLGEKFFGLDFEDCRPGLPEEDLGRFCAYVLTYNPAFTRWKYQFVAACKEIVAEKLNLTWGPVFLELQKELESMSRRRKKQNLAADFYRQGRAFNLIP